MYQRLIIFLLVVVIMVHSIQSATIEPPDDDTNDLLVRNAKGGIDWACTNQCFKWWSCRIKCLFFCKCDQPAGCDCSKFAWE